MIKIIDAPDIEVAIDHDSGTATLICKGMGPYEMDAFIAENKAAPVIVSLSKIVKGWKLIGNSQGEDIDFSMQSLGALLDKIPDGVDQLMAGYMSAIREAREKN